MRVVSSSADQGIKLLTEVHSDKKIPRVVYNIGGNSLVESWKLCLEVACNVLDDGHKLWVMLQK